MSKQQSRKATIEAFKDNLAILKMDGLEIKIPRDLITENSQIGETVYLIIQDQKQYQSKNEQNAKQILNEILRDKAAN